MLPGPVAARAVAKAALIAAGAAPTGLGSDAAGSVRLLAAHSAGIADHQTHIGATRGARDTMPPAGGGI